MSTLVTCQIGQASTFDPNNPDMVLTTDESQNTEKWRLTGIDNYYGSTLRTTITERVNDHGAFTPGKSFRTSKSMSIGGVVTSSSAAIAEAEAWDAIAGISPDGLDVVLRVQDAAGWRRMTVRANGAALVTPITDVSAKFSIAVTAYDPRKYSDVPLSQTTGLLAAQPVGAGLVYPLFGGVSPAHPLGGLMDYGNVAQNGAITAANNGTAETYPVFTIYGGGLPQGFEVVDTVSGNMLRYVNAVAASDTLTIDMRNKRVINAAGGDLTDGLVEADNIILGKYDSRSFVFRSLGTYSGNPQLTITTQDAWW